MDAKNTAAAATVQRALRGRARAHFSAGPYTAMDAVLMVPCKQPVGHGTSEALHAAGTTGVEEAVPGSERSKRAGQERE